MSTQVWHSTTTPQIDADTAFEGKPMHIRSRIVAREFKTETCQTCMREALNAILSFAASHSPEFSLMHVDVSHAHIHAKGQRLALVKLPAEDCSGKDKGKIGLLKKSMYGTRDAASNWERYWQGHLENWSYEVGRSSRNLFHHKRRKTHGDDFVVTGTKGSMLELKKQLESVRNQGGHHRSSFGKECQGAESENTLVRDRDIASTRSPTR